MSKKYGGILVSQIEKKTEIAQTNSSSVSRLLNNFNCNFNGTL